MRGADIIRLTVNGVRQRRLRSWLTIVGIIIGVGAVVALSVMGDTFDRAIRADLSTLGGDSLTVTPGFERAQQQFGPPDLEEALSIKGLTDADVRVVKSTTGIQYVDGVVSTPLTVTYRGESLSLAIQGVDPAIWRLMENAGLGEGRMLFPGDQRAAVIGSDVARGKFTNEVLLNTQIMVGGSSLRVVGILEQAGALGLEDSQIFVPKETLRDVTGDTSDEVSYISAVVADGHDVSTVADELSTNLLRSRHLLPGDQDFTVVTSEQIQEQVTSALATFTVFLGGIAAISLVVGGIGIANTMYMSVVERARQIGILKAVGAKNRDILALFLTESSIIGLVGGVIGIALGYGVAWLAIAALVSVSGPEAEPLTPILEPQLAALALLFGVLVGSASGVFPALRAARLDPVDTLRGE